MGMVWMLKDSTNTRESGGGKLLSYQLIQRHVPRLRLRLQPLEFSLPPNLSWNPRTDIALSGIICSYGDFLVLLLMKINYEIPLAKNGQCFWCQRRRALDGSKCCP